jgi:NAD(P)-dependent dehydrogenase (short-subunit alcohol dehydrogenase family)
MMDSKIVLVTGATDGLGKGVALALVHAGTTVLVHGRDPDRIARAADEIRCVAGADAVVRTYRADFASLEDVRAL